MLALKKSKITLRLQKPENLHIKIQFALRHFSICLFNVEQDKKDFNLRFCLKTEKY